MKDNEGKNALHYAAKTCNKKMLITLLRKISLSPLAQDNNGNTSLHIVAARTKGTIHNAEFDIQGDQLQTLFAAKLFFAKIDGSAFNPMNNEVLSIKNKEGLTVIDIATRYHNLPFWAVLVQRGIPCPDLSMAREIIENNLELINSLDQEAIQLKNKLKKKLKKI